MAEEPFSDRLKRLEDRIAAARAGRAEAARGHQREFTQGSLAWRMVIELVVGMVLGLAIGFGLDALFGTRPVFLVVFALLGFAAGVRTMLRTAKEVQSGKGEAALMRRGRRGRGLRGKPMAEAAGGSGFNIHPMEQFEVHPLFGDGAGPLVHPDQRHALDGAGRRLRQPADDRRLARPGAGAVAGAVDRRDRSTASPTR